MQSNNEVYRLHILADKLYDEAKELRAEADKREQLAGILKNLIFRAESAERRLQIVLKAREE